MGEFEEPTTQCIFPFGRVNEVAELMKNINVNTHSICAEHSVIKHLKK